jgi:hypothetical protein
MAKPKKRRPSIEQPDLYDLYDELDRLEELIEDMTALGVTSVEQAEARMLVLNQQIDELEAILDTP